jgi:hypothetical protein
VAEESRDAPKSPEQLAQLRVDRDGYKRAYESIQSEIGQLRSDRDGYKRAYETMQSEVGQLRSDRDGYKHAYETMQADVGQLRADRDGYKQAYETLQSEVGQLRADRDALQQASQSLAAEESILVREGDDTTVIPKGALALLVRESRLLREQAGQLAQMRREMEIMRANQSDAAAAASVEPDLKPVDNGFYSPVFHFDGMANDPRIIHNHDFLKDPRFVAAYSRAIKAAGVDYKYYWRVHVALWCASHALTLPGDFVECGVWRGVLSTAIMQYHDWNKLNRRFILFDTFRGFDEKQLTDEEISKGNVAHFREHYQQDIYDDVVRNFSEYQNVEIVRGPVPDTLSNTIIDQVCYLSIDMNNAAPEIAAARFFWDRLAPGAPVLLDDYGFVGYEVQKRAWDAFSIEQHAPILALPTGQGLLLKPGT